MPDNPTLNQFLSQSRTMLDGALNKEDVLTRLEPLGYDAELIQDLLAAIDEVEALTRRQQQEYAEQYEASDAFREAFGTLRQQLQRHRRLARLAFDEEGHIYNEILSLNGSPAGTYDGLVQQATEFYSVLRDRPDLLAQFAQFSITDEVVQSAIDGIDGVRRAKTIQNTEMGEAQEATQARDDVASDLRGRMADFMEIVRIATADRPQLREALGMITPA